MRNLLELKARENNYYGGLTVVLSAVENVFFRSMIEFLLAKIWLTLHNFKWQYSEIVSSCLYVHLISCS